LQQWRTSFGFDLYLDFHDDDRGVLADLRGPISNEWTEFDRCTIAATKVFVDYLNESTLAKEAQQQIASMKDANPDKPVRGIDKLEAWLIENGREDAPVQCIASLRLVQELRSKSAAHRKSSALEKLLSEKGLGQESPRTVYQILVLGPMLEYCRQLAEFARTCGPNQE